MRGYDGAKKLSGRKRHVFVETQGLLVRVTVHAADIQDRAGVPRLLAGANVEFPRMSHVWVDQGYTGTGRRWSEQELGWTVEVVQHPPKPRGVWAPPGAVIDWAALRPKGFRGVLPRRWVVERSFAWKTRFRRLVRDYERLAATLMGLHVVAFAMLMLQRFRSLGEVHNSL